MIEIQDIINKSKEEITNLLLNENTLHFKLYVPKSTQTFASPNSEIAKDYAMLAFAGQKLSDIADKFSYCYVSPSIHESVLFEIETSNLEQLADTISNISDGYDSESMEDVFYLDYVFEYIEKVIAKEITPVCPDFIYDYQEYNSRGNENNNRYVYNIDV